MQSLAQRHLNRHGTASQPTGGEDTPRPADRQLQALREALYARLQVETVKLKAIRSRNRRNQHKRELLPEFVDYLTAAMNSGETATDLILVRCCIWAMDCESWSLFFPLANHAVSCGMDSPAEFSRTLPEIILEEMASAASHAREPAAYADLLVKVEAITAGHDITDVIRAKFYRVLGDVKTPLNPGEALSAYQTAEQYGAKVKTKIEKLNRSLKK